MNLTETNRQINMTSEYSVSSFKAIWVLRVSTSFNTVALVRSAVILFQCLLNSALAEKEPSSPIISTEASFNYDSNEKFLIWISLSAAIENKWHVNYIQTLPAQIQQKMLRKILEKVFITKKCTQCKTSHTLKTDVFELPDNRNIGKLFSKYELIFLDQTNFSYIPFQVLILQYWYSHP